LALFQAIGTNYGAGNGSTTFQIPDLRGYFIRGYGVNADGTTSGAFAAKQGDIFAAHTHVTTSGGDNGPLFALQGGGHSPVYQYTETTSTGGTETRPKNIALVYCIKT
jgi:microcystin-dependent protein